MKKMMKTFFLWLILLSYFYATENIVVPFIFDITKIEFARVGLQFFLQCLLPGLIMGLYNKAVCKKSDYANRVGITIYNAVFMIVTGIVFFFLYGKVIDINDTYNSFISTVFMLSDDFPGLSLWFYILFMLFDSVALIIYYAVKNSDNEAKARLAKSE